MHQRSEACCDDMYFNMKKEQGRNGKKGGVRFVGVATVSGALPRCAFYAAVGVQHSCSFEGRLHLLLGVKVQYTLPFAHQIAHLYKRRT